MSSVWELFPELPWGTLVKVIPGWSNNLPRNYCDDFFAIVRWSRTTSSRQIVVVHLGSGNKYQVYPDEIQEIQ